MIDMSRNVTAADILDPKRAKREAQYNPGPASTSRKKRRQIGAYVKHTDEEGNRHERNVPHPKLKRRVVRKARKAIGARGVKTNSQRSGRK